MHILPKRQVAHCFHFFLNVWRLKNGRGCHTAKDTLFEDEAGREGQKFCLDHSLLLAAPSSWACKCQWYPGRRPASGTLAGNKKAAFQALPKTHYEIESGLSLAEGNCKSKLYNKLILLYISFLNNWSLPIFFKETDLTLSTIFLKAIDLNPSSFKQLISPLPSAQCQLLRRQQPYQPYHHCCQP